MSLVAPRRFQIVEAPTPAADDLAEGQVLIRVLAGGICGSDMPRWKGMRTLHPDDSGGLAPEIGGFPLHEIAGEITHSAHPDRRAGELVVGWALAFDGLAEYVVTSGDAVAPHDAALAPHIAVMLQPLACVLQAVERLPDVAGRHVAVVGLGPIGLLFGHVVKSAGARHVTGVDRVDRRDVARRFGFDEIVVASSDRWAASLTPDRQPEVVVEAVGHQVGTLTDAVLAVAPRGCIFYFGIPDDPVYPLPMLMFLRKDLTLVSGVTREYTRGLIVAGDYARAHPEVLDGYVTHVVPFERAQEAYDLAERPVHGQVKVVVQVGTGSTRGRALQAR